MNYRTPQWKDVKPGANHYRMPGDFSLFEEDADEFAGAFLMPEAEFVKIASEHADSHSERLKKLSEYFNVSGKAAFTRGRKLGLWK